MGQRLVSIEVAGKGDGVRAELREARVYVGKRASR